jgi:putative DNA primase/helicase
MNARLRWMELPREEIVQRSHRVNEDQYADKLAEDVALKRAQHHADDSPKAVAQDALLEQVDQTDAGNVARLYELTSGDVRYVHESKVWIRWNGTHWDYDKSHSEVHRLTLRVAASYRAKATRLEKEANDPSTSNEQRKSLEKAAKSIRKWESQCRSRLRIDAMICLAKRDPRFVISATELDRDPDLLGVANGVVCLRTGTLRKSSRADFILLRSPVAFDPAASTTRLHQFVGEITAYPDGLDGGKVKAQPRPILSHYLQKVCGYWLTGQVKEQVMFMPTGKGANGKNVLVDLFRSVSGGYCEVIPPEVLLASRSASNSEQANPSIRKLAGVRCAISSESKDGAQLDVAVVKRHTGDTAMTARFLHKDPITFDTTHKLVLLTNHPPRVEQMDDAIKGRLHVIPFDMCWNRPGAVDYDPALPDADKDLLDKLKSDAQGALRFFVEGAVAYYREGLKPPPEVLAFTQGYIEEQDTVRLWINEGCETCSTEQGATALQLFNAYQIYCVNEGEQPQVKSVASLGKRLKVLVGPSIRDREGARYGLRPRLINPAPSN